MAVALCFFLHASPAAAETPGAAVDEALGRLLSLLETFMRSVPAFETPEVLDNGDIIIRRKKAAPEPPASPPLKKPDGKKKGGPDTTRT